MDILVISDTHGRRDAITALLSQLSIRPGAVLFLGDGLRDLGELEALSYEGVPLYAVAGNCDGSIMFPPDEPQVRTLVLDGCRIVMMHGHTFGVKYGAREAIRYAAEQGADVLLYGHTHKGCAYMLSADEAPHGKPLIVANPGSLGEPRDGDEASFGMLTIRGGKPLFSHGALL